jgi:hypothetical protein
MQRRESSNAPRAGNDAEAVELAREEARHVVVEPFVGDFDA